MTKPKVQLTTFDNRLMQVVPENAEAAVDIVNKALKAGKIDGVNIFGFKSQSVEFLARLRPMQRVNFQICRDIDTSPLHGQKGLRRLVCASEPVEVDVSHFPQLRNFSGFWHRRSTGLDALKHLEKVSLWPAGSALSGYCRAGPQPNRWRNQDHSVENSFDCRRGAPAETQETRAQLSA